MPLIATPQIQSYTSSDGKKHYAVSFAYDFAGDNSGPLVYGGYAFVGSQYRLDLSALPGAGAWNIPVMRSLQFNCQFQLPESGSGYTDLLTVFSQATQQLVTIGGSLYSDGDTHPNIQSVSGMVPLIAPSSSAILFAKKAWTTGTAPVIYNLFGVLNATLFDEEFPAYTNTYLDYVAE